MQRSRWLGLVLGVVVGLAAGAGAGWILWGRRASTLAGRLTALESEAAQVAGERERLHRELSDIVRERQEMANTAEHLRAQVETQLKRLQSLAEELAPPPPEDGEPPVAAP